MIELLVVKDPPEGYELGNVIDVKAEGAPVGDREKVAFARLRVDMTQSEAEEFFLADGVPNEAYAKEWEEHARWLHAQAEAHDASVTAIRAPDAPRGSMALDRATKQFFDAIVAKDPALMVKKHEHPLYARRIDFDALIAAVDAGTATQIAKTRTPETETKDAEIPVVSRAALLAATVEQK